MYGRQVDSDPRASDKQRICVSTQCKTSNTQLKSNLSVSKTHTKNEIRKQIKMRAYSIFGRYGTCRQQKQITFGKLNVFRKYSVIIGINCQKKCPRIFNLY